MIYIYIFYFAVLTIFILISAFAIDHVVRFRHAGDGTTKVVVVYLIISAVLIISSFVTLVGTDWELIL